jgi:hypothetical protein
MTEGWTSKLVSDDAEIHTVEKFRLSCPIDFFCSEQSRSQELHGFNSPMQTAPKLYRQQIGSTRSRQLEMSAIISNINPPSGAFGSN